jgi:hypothetical protein
VPVKARAGRWQRLLDQGGYASVTEIAAAERISKSYVSWIVRLALLAANPVEAILAGGDLRDRDLSSIASGLDPARRPDRTAAERQHRRQEQKLAREDGALFLPPDRVAQKTAAPVRLLRRMALKELTDHAAAGCARSNSSRSATNYRIGDHEPGLDREHVPLLGCDMPDVYPDCA